MQRLNEIIESLIEVIKTEDLAIDDVTLFQEACSFMRGELASISKQSSFQQREIAKASEEQKKLLKKLGYTESMENMTKFQASKLISEKLATKKQKIY